ncbi:LOW QUALITY PROTEIN: abortive infection protein, partial [Rhodococcus opacus PD630]
EWCYRSESGARARIAVGERSFRPLDRAPRRRRLPLLQRGSRGTVGAAVGAGVGVRRRRLRRPDPHPSAEQLRGADSANPVRRHPARSAGASDARALEGAVSQSERPRRPHDDRFALLNLAVSAGLALIVQSLFDVASNEAVDDAGKASALDTVAFYVGTGIQLVGEEVFTMIPFLAVMYFLFAKAKLSRKTAIVVAWLLSAVWFGAAHLQTYDWNFAQAFIVIGGARLVLTLAYIRTKNLWVSTGAHIINDWTLFTQAIVLNAALFAL